MRECYYARGLVAPAVKLNSNMSPEEMQKVIIERFSNLPEMPDFEFVKAVDESLVSPSVDLWDFLTLKHVIGQGPIYIRSVSKSSGNIGNCLSNDDDDDDLKDYVLTTKKEHSKPFSLLQNQIVKTFLITHLLVKLHPSTYLQKTTNLPHAMNHVQVRISSFLNQNKQTFSVHSVMICLPVNI